MLTKESLEKLISQDENKNLELKKSTGELKEGMRSACAFLNSEGDLFDDRIMQNRPRKYAWELQPAENISIEDLDKNRIRGSVRVGVEGGRISEMSLHASIPEILEKWELLEHGVVNNAAAVLFATKRTGDFVLRMARFRGTDKLHFVDNQRIHGNFYELMDAGMAFFFKHLSLSGEITGWFREEHLDIPVAALREALINAICHRDYEMYQCSIGIAIYDDRIEIESPGLLPHPLTPDTIKQPHRSYPRNKTMASVLYSTMILESWGSGIKRIMDACKADGTEEPTWHEETGFVVVTFPFNKLNGMKVKKTDDPQNVTHVTQNVTQNVTQSNRLECLKQAVESNLSISKADLAALTGVSKRTIIRDLKILGYKWKGPSKTGHWEK